MFFSFRQNNSGGRWDIDPKRGISVNVIVEADDWEHANYLAERIGLYFDGSGDCGCCGTRWSSLWKYDEGTPAPMHYSQEVGENKPARLTGFGIKWTDQGQPEGYIHHSDKRIEPFDVIIVKDTDE